MIEDRSLDVRPDADVLAVPAQQQVSPGAATEVGSAPAPTIDDVLAEFLAAQEQRLAARTFANYRTVVDLLRHCLNGYGHQYLDDVERSRFDHAFEGGDEEAFVHPFGPEKIADVLSEFLDYFMVRKVMAGEELLRAAGTVTKKLAKWMAANGYLDAEAAGEAVERGAGAARDLPRAERLSRLLYEHAQRVAKDYQRDPDVRRPGGLLHHRAGRAWRPVAHRWHRPSQRRHDGEFARPGGMVGVPRLVAVSSGLADPRGRERIPVDPSVAAWRWAAAVIERTGL